MVGATLLRMRKGSHIVWLPYPAPEDTPQNTYPHSRRRSRRSPKVEPEHIEPHPYVENLLTASFSVPTLSGGVSSSLRRSGIATTSAPNADREIDLRSRETELFKREAAVLKMEEDTRRRLQHLEGLQQELLANATLSLESTGGMASSQGWKVAVLKNEEDTGRAGGMVSPRGWKVRVLKREEVTRRAQHHLEGLQQELLANKTLSREGAGGIASPPGCEGAGSMASPRGCEVTPLLSPSQGSPLSRSLSRAEITLQRIDSFLHPRASQR
eukprot:TRINITY_DN32346_c0_g1_i1.p1 TRINITY_DN32346_c0_g1~~TRINITY_DN32346_c0_g1_i1.p1  ORF type:complete len:296 (+),score=42.18 TRINITY_DN32346_c0_g1_i1:80-889(+)